MLEYLPNDIKESNLYSNEEIIRSSVVVVLEHIPNILKNFLTKIIFLFKCLDFYQFAKE